MSLASVLAMLAIVTAAPPDTVSYNGVPAYPARFMAAAIHLQVVLKAARLVVTVSKISKSSTSLANTLS